MEDPDVRTGAPSRPSPDGRPPDRVTMGLLAYLSASAMDGDYAVAAARRRSEAGESGTRANGGRRTGRLRVAGVLFVFALLAATAAAQTSENSGTVEQQRQELIAQVKDRRAKLDSMRVEIVGLRAEVRVLENRLLSSGQLSTGVLADLARLGARSGTDPVRGPGVEVIVDDAPNATSDRNKVLDSDLQALVNGLWEAGAEAISINGERLTALSAIRHAGSAITVNFTSLSRPYRVLAIGDPQTMPSRFADTTSGQTWFDLQREVGLRFTMRAQQTMRLPGAGIPALRFAQPEATGKETS